MKWLGRLWALPLTAACILVAKLGGAERYKFADPGSPEFIARPGSLLYGWFLRNNFSAFTWGDCIVWGDAWTARSGEARRHERRHTEQAHWFGVFLPIAYLIEALAAVLRGGHWYSDNWFERDAVRAEERP